MTARLVESEKAPVLRALNVPMGVLGRALELWLWGDEGALDEVMEAGDDWVPWGDGEDG